MDARLFSLCMCLPCSTLLPFRLVFLLVFAIIVIFLGIATSLRWQHCVNHKKMAVVAIDDTFNPSVYTTGLDGLLSA